MNIAHESLCMGFGNQVSETEIMRTSIQEFLNTSIDPYMSMPTLHGGSSSAASLDMESLGPSSTSAMAALAHQTSAILTDITSQASMGEDEAIEGFNTILRREEPYASWTMSSSHYVSPGQLPSFQSFENVDSYSTFHDLSFLGEPFEGGSNISAPQEWASSARRGKEILVEEADLVIPPGKGVEPPPLSPNLNLMQQDLLEKLRTPTSPKTYRSSRPPGEFPPGHIPTSLFVRPRNRHLQFPRGGVGKKRKPLIYKWATSLAPRIKSIREDVPGGSSFNSGLSPGSADVYDTKSPSSVAHEIQAALAHKLAERNRRMKFSHKLQTLISIVPMVNKKKDKVSVLSSTIDYIRQLTLRISNLKRVEEEVSAPSTSGAATGAAPMTVDREPEEMSTLNEGGPSTSSPVGGAPAVVVEGAPGDDTWVIKVEANNRTRSLIQLLNVLLDLELGVVNVDYGTRNDRFHATICVKNSKSSSRSSSELQATLSRVLESRDSSGTGSD